MKRRAVFIASLVVLALLGGGGVVLWQGRSDETTVRTVVVERRDVVQEVSFTGNVRADREAQLGFEFGGTLSERAVAVGDEVAEGQLIARLDDRLSQLELAQARAERASAQEKAHVTLQTAQTAAEQAEAEGARLVEQRRQAVRDAKSELDQKRVVYQQVGREEEEGTSAVKTAQANVVAAESAYHAAQQALLATQRSVATADAKAQAAIQEAQTAYQATLTAAPHVAGLSSVEATEALASVKLAKSMLVAPFAGVVTAVESEVGEYIAPGTAVVTVAAPEMLKVTADVPETDALQLSIGLPAQVTFDAFSSGEVWEATVTDIAPSARVLEGVPTYEVTVQLSGDQERLRLGLTANVTVHVAEQSKVLVVPRRAIFRQDDHDYVRVRGADGVIVEREVTTGLIGSTGLVEIQTGLQEGEVVVTGALTDS